ncbi:MAG: polyprenyl synthetase family protein [Bacteroidales bacterium]|nr:polyprenyl synthetase family protein [Bacteroidales bacterium]
MLTLNQLSDKVTEYFNAEQFTGTPSQLFDPIAYTLAQGGKRIRPLLLLAANDLFGGDIEQARYAAIGIETFHNFTLLHDDLMDKSPVRRGKPTVYVKWDQNTAILSGDAMNILAFQYFLKTPHRNLHEILQTFQQTSMEICQGQQYDMNFEKRDDVTISEYMEMIRLKTAVLLGGALKIGALYAEAAPSDTDAIYNFGINIGLAFQLRDDLLDAYGTLETFGKQPGTDIKDNKKTILFLKALQKGSPAQRQQLNALFATTPDDPTQKIKQVLDIYAQLDIRKEVETSIAELHNNAMKKLDSIARPESDKQPLQQIANKLLNRLI